MRGWVDKLTCTLMAIPKCIIIITNLNIIRARNRMRENINDITA